MLNSRDKLYSALSGQFDLGSQEEFDSKMNSPQSRRKLYDAVSAKVDLGSYDEFESKVSPVKKKESSVSTSTTQNGSGASVQKDGFSDSQKSSLGKFKLDSEDLQNVSIGNKPKTLDVPKEADLTMRKVQLEKQIATKPQDRKDFKQNPKYASAKEELHDVNNKLQQVKEVENQKNAQLDSSIENAIFTVDDNKIKSAIDSEVNDNEISDYAREGGKNVLNVLGGIANIAPKTINALSGGKLDLPTYEPFEKKIPFEKATKQVNDEIKEAKKKDPNLEVTPEEFNKRVKDVFVEQQKQNQYQENASKLLADADPKVQERIKAKYINEIGGLDKSAKANSVLIQALDNKATPLRKELLATKQLIDSGKADPTVVADFNSKLENYNQMEQQYAKLVSEQEKNSNKKLTAEERLKLFRLDYNPYSKAIDDLVTPTAKMVGEGLYALGKAEDFIGDLEGKRNEHSLKEAGDDLINASEEVTARHPSTHFSDINSFGKLGSWITQTVGQVAPYALGSAIGTTEEQALSKAFLTPSKALAGFSTASAGGAMNEMDTEIANNPNLHYNNWQYAGKVLGSVGSNAIMFGNYGSMLKGNKALFESITKTPEANVEFQKGIKDYLDTALKTGKGMNKSGAVMMGSQAINMFVDNHILGKKHEDGFDELANAYIEGSAMHGLISEVPNLASFMIEKVLPNGAKKEINQNLKKGYGLVKELQNPDLTPDEKSVIQTQIDAIHKDNERLLKASNKVVEGFTHNQVKELLKIDQDKFEITKDVEDIKKGNYSKEYKENALAEKKAEFYALESRRQAVFENEHNALTLLPKSEQNRLEREAKNRIAEKEGKDVSDIKFEPKEVNDTALRIHKTELKEQAVKDAEAKIPTPETKSEAEVQEPTITKEQKVENFDVTLPENKENIAVADSPNGFILFDSETKKPIEIFNDNAGENKGISKFYDTKEEAQSRIEELTNEAQAQGDNLSNGDIRVGNEPSGENTASKQQVIEPKSVPEAVDNGASEKPIEVEHNGIVYSKNEKGTWTNTKSGNEVKGIGEKGKSLIKTLEEKETYGNNEQITEGVAESKSDKIGGEKPEIQKEPTRQEKVVEKKKIVDAKIDDFANSLKDLLPKGFDAEGLKKNGFSQDELIDIVAKAAKTLANTGIEINEAVRQVIEKLKEHFEDFNISEKDVFDKHFAEPMITDKDGNEYTSLKRSIADAEREADGKEAKFTPTGKSAEKRQQETFDKIKTGEITEQEITDLTTALATGEMDNFYTKLSPEQQEHVLLYNKVKLKNEAIEINNEIEANADNPQKQAEAIVKKVQNEILTEENYDASVRLKGEWGRQGQAMQLAIANDYSNEGILHKLKVASVDKEIPKATREIVAKMAKDIEDLQTKLDESQKKIDAHDEEVKKLLDEKAELEEKISKTKGEEKLEKLKALKGVKEVKKATIEKKKQDTINSIKAKYKRLSGNVSSGGNLKLLELAPDITALAKLHVQEGVVELEELIGKMLVELQDAIPDLTERDLRDVFSGYGKTVKPSTDENARTLSELKSKARALSGLEDVKDLGIAPLKSGVTHRPPTEEVLELRREIKREMREQGIDITKEKDPEDVWKTALESYKTKIKNRIEYLENIEKTKDIDKFLRDKKKTKLKLDEEARKLKKQQQQEKNKVDDLVAKHDFENWTKLRKTLHYAGRYAKGNLISAPTTLVKIASSLAWRSLYKVPQAVSMYGASKGIKAYGTAVESIGKTLNSERLISKGEHLKTFSNVQGINSRKDLADHIIDYYTNQYSKKNISESISTFVQHASNEDILLGKYRAIVPLPRIRGNEKLNIAQKAFFGHLKFLESISAASHGAVKNMAALPEHEAWKHTILRNLIKEGIPLSMMQDGTAEQIANQLGYMKGQRARFMQDNAIASWKSEQVAKMNNKKMAIAGELLDLPFPIVKIGSNYTGEVLEKHPLVGLAPHIIRALSGKEMFDEKQKSDLLRALANQGVGVFSMLAGAMLYQNISPFYGTNSKDYADKNGKKLPEDEDAIGFIKGVYTHSPDAVSMKAGATMMWYWDMYDKAHPEEKNSMMNFMGALFNREAITGEIHESPYITASESTIAPLLNPKSDLGKAGANFIRSRVPFGDFTKTLAQGELPIANKLFPETGKELAKKVGLHPEEVKPSDIKLYPKGLKDNLLIGLPNWRKEVLKKLYDDKYGAGKVKTDINSEIDKLLHEGETEQKKQKFLQGLKE